MSRVNWSLWSCTEEGRRKERRSKEKEKTINISSYWWACQKESEESCWGKNRRFYWNMYNITWGKLSATMFWRYPKQQWTIPIQKSSNFSYLISYYRNLNFPRLNWLIRFTCYFELKLHAKSLLSFYHTLFSPAFIND